MNFLRKFMQGRYGVDQLNKFLLVVFVALSFAFMITRYSILNIISLVILFFLYFRIFSKNINKRLLENRKYLEFSRPYRNALNKQIRKFKDRKDYRYFKCPNCEKSLRVPKGKGMIQITCPNCKTKIRRKS